MKKTIKNKTYEFKEDFWWGIDKNGKEFKVTVKSLLETLNKVDDTLILEVENSVLKEAITPLTGTWITEEQVVGAKEKEYQLTGTLNLEDEVVDISKVKDSSKGLGDTIAKITTALGIEPCEPCIKRKEALNKMFPYLKKDVRELTEEEVELVDSVLNKTMIDGKTITKLFALYNNLFSTKLEKCSCPGLLKKIIERLTVVRG